jgi:hypothetical protein
MRTNEKQQIVIVVQERTAALLSDKQIETASAVMRALQRRIAHNRSTLSNVPTVDAPRSNSKTGLYQSVDGKPMFAVTVRAESVTTPGKGRIMAIVDPSTNQFYVTETWGAVVPDKVFWKGPGRLPANARFKEGIFSVEQVRELEIVANNRKLSILRDR